MNLEQRTALHHAFRKLGYTTNGQTAELLDLVDKLLPVAETRAAIDVFAERMRQVSDEGHSFAEDDRNGHDGLRNAAAAYLIAAPHDTKRRPECWPWPPRWYKPKSVRENMVRAGALVLAAIEVYDRINEHIRGRLA